VTGEVIGHAGHHHRLVHVDHTFINVANRTYQWVDVQRFRLREAVSADGALLAALIAHERFGNDYATRPGDNPERHGPYWRDRITPACYDPIDSDTAERHVRAWAGRFAPVPEHLRPELERAVYQPLRAADRVYQLRDLGPAPSTTGVGSTTSSTNGCCSAAPA
jgi:hypothetical protein